MICVGLVGLVAVLWIKAERKASHLYDMCKKAEELANRAKEVAEKALDQRDELRAELKEAKEMIALQREIIEEASNSICELVCYEAGYCDEDETLETLINNHFDMLWTKTIGMLDSDTVEEYKTNVAIRLEEKAKVMADYYDTVITNELEEQYDNVIDLSIYRNRR
jgi:hypothetical protein